jgi:hypothetical protein
MIVMSTSHYIVCVISTKLYSCDLWEAFRHAERRGKALHKPFTLRDMCNMSLFYGLVLQNLLSLNGISLKTVAWFFKASDSSYPSYSLVDLILARWIQSASSQHISLIFTVLPPLQDLFYQSVHIFIILMRDTWSAHLIILCLNTVVMIIMIVIVKITEIIIIIIIIQ